MNKTILKLKREILSTRVGRIARDIIHQKNYTMKNAKIASVSYYGDERFAEDMLHEARNYEVMFHEYRMYYFEKLSQEERRQYIPVREGIKYIEKLNSYRASYLFCEKAKTYERFKQYYKRDLFELKKYTDTEKSLLKEMAGLHKRLIFKPYDGGEGRGIEIRDFEKESFEDIWNDIRKNYKNGCVAEEIVCQCKELDEIVSGVLNTVRISTVVFPDRVKIFETSWRCGRKGSIVDNCARGGLSCGLDANGVIASVVAENGIEYENHPDTEKKLIGFQIPEFDQAIAMAKELALVCPKVRYVGWDLALTDKGWVMIEGNAEALVGISQIHFHTGVRPRLDAIMKELNL